MKKYLLISCLVLLCTQFLVAQTKPKPKPKDSAPTQKEMNEAMSEMQKAMDNMSPEDKKALDSLGIKLPSTKNLPKPSDKQLEKGWEDANRLVPAKDVVRISTISATPSNAALPSFVMKVNTAFENYLPEKERVNAEAAYQSLKQNAGISLSNAAISFWLMGSPLTAIYIMGKACQEEPANTDHINNYASMVSMAGAEQAAIPILLNLNKQFPGNSTILNNLGQAWFGLGDMEKSSRYLDSAIRIYAYHSEANYTKCLIEESKGNTTAAVDAMLRSIKKSYSAEKESKLKKLGKKISGKEVDFPFPMPQDPLGLEKFSWPAYPKSVMESSIQEAAWDAFREKCDAEINQLNAKSARLEQESMEATQKRMTALIQASNAGKPIQALPWYAPIAALKLGYLVDDKDGKLEQQMKARGTKLEEVLLHISQYNSEREASEKQLGEVYDPQIGEGRPNPLAAYCNAVNGVRSNYLERSNSELEMFEKNMIEEERKRTNNQVYYAQYINWPDEFEVIKVHAQIQWLTLIKTQIVKFQEQGPFCKPGELDKELISQKTKLKEFDEVACQYHSKFDLQVMEFNNDCSFFEGKLKLGPLNYSRKINSDDHDRLIAASLELTVGAGKSFERGPAKAEVNAEIKGKLEWNDKEFTNWEVSSGVNVSAGSNLGQGDKSIDIAAVNAHIGMNSAANVTSKILGQNFSLSGK